MKIAVTQRHIDQGVPGDCEACPLALALREVLPPDCRVTVGDDLVYVSMEDWGDVARLPDPAVDFVRAFDRGDPVRPFGFEVEVVEP